MDQEIDSDPDFEEFAADPFRSSESEIDDSDHENDPRGERLFSEMLTHILSAKTAYELIQKYISKLGFTSIDPFFVSLYLCF